MDHVPWFRHCERSAAVHALGSHGLLHFIRNDREKGRNDGVLHQANQRLRRL